MIGTDLFIVMRIALDPLLRWANCCYKIGFWTEIALYFSLDSDMVIFVINVLDSDHYYCCCSKRDWRRKQRLGESGKNCLPNRETRRDHRYWWSLFKLPFAAIFLLNCYVWSVDFAKLFWIDDCDRSWYILHLCKMHHSWHVANLIFHMMHLVGQWIQ